MLFRSVLAEDALADHLDSLNRIIQAGFDRYLKTSDRHVHSPRSRASLIHDFIVDEAMAHFSNIKGVHCFFSSQLFLMNFSGKVLLRLKKLGEGNRTSNVSTLQSSMFEDQVQTEMFGEPVRLTAGYHPNESFTEIIYKIITYFSNNKEQWTIPIEANSVDENVTPIELFNPIEKPKKRARLRQADLVAGGDKDGTTGG